MKSIHYIITLLLGFTFLTGCDTDPNGPMPDTFEEGGLAYLLPDATSSGLINPADFNAFVFKGQIGVLFEPNFEKLTMKVVYNGNFNNQVVLIDNIVTTPHNYEIRISDLIAKIPQLNSTADIKIDDTFTFFVNATIGGKEYPVYKVIDNKPIRTIGSGLIQSLQAIKGAKAQTDITISVPCGFVASAVTGNYRATSSTWGVNGPVTITRDPADQFIVYVAGLAAIDGLNEDRGPLKMVIDPNSYNVTAVKTVVASSTLGWGPAYGYTNIAYAGTGKLNTCNGTYTMNFTITVDQGSFGSYAFTFTKL